MTIELSALAAAAVSVLGPYFGSAGFAFAEKAGEQLAEKAGDLYRAIKRKFADDNDAEQTLSRVQAKPDSKHRLAEFQEALVEKMTADGDFAALVNGLIGEVKQADVRKILVFGDHNVTAGGDIHGNTFYKSS
jgi:aldehyde:ferredoxin oxidoreductase